MPAKKKGKGGKKKGGKKKPKLTKAERAQLKLDKACALITDQQDVYQNFLDRMERWMFAHKLKARELYLRFDKNGDGVLSYDEFKAGMLDLEAPCNATELEVLARRLDKDKNGTIDYREFSKGLHFASSESEDTEEAPMLITRDSLCRSGCKLGHWRDHVERHPRYVRVHLRSMTFDHLKSYPGHFNRVVLSHSSVHSLCCMIKEELALSTTTLLIYHDKTKDALALDPSRTLEDYGIKGRTRDDPEEVTMFYNYTTEFHDCSLLSADYYFIK
ncbi:uncharacterized protein [Diadema setosum]|uniref:uncharacterized protein n=1 Tax=Diadema setosum TaxID=31175 RepID=UPI003B3B44C6